MANTFIFEFSKKIQSKCDNDDLCPESIDQWEPQLTFLSRKPCFESEITKLGIFYPVRYTVSEDRMDFTAEVTHGFNMGVYVHGGVGKKLKAFYSCEDTDDKEIPMKVKYNGNTCPSGCLLHRLFN
jgi:hypothetical protein